MPGSGVFATSPSENAKTLNEQVKTYSFTFAQWVASTDNIAPLVELIGHDDGWERSLPDYPFIFRVSFPQVFSSGSPAAIRIGSCVSRILQDIADTCRSPGATPRRPR